MDATRRETIAAVLAGGLGTGVGLSVLSEGLDTSGGQRTGTRIPEDEMDVLISLAEVVYPSAVSEHADIVAGYLGYQRPARLRAIRGAVQDLDRAAKRRHHGGFATLGADQRETLLRELGVDRAGGGRVRYCSRTRSLLARRRSPVRPVYRPGRR